MSVATPAIHQRQCSSCMVACTALVLAMEAWAQSRLLNAGRCNTTRVEQLRESCKASNKTNSEYTIARKTQTIQDHSYCLMFVRGLGYLSSWTLASNAAVTLPAVPVGDVNTCAPKSAYDGSCSWAHLHYSEGECGSDMSQESCIAYHESNYNRPSPTNKDTQPLPYFELRARAGSVMGQTPVFQFTKRRTDETHAQFAEVIKQYVPVIGAIHTDSLSNVAALVAGTVYTYDDTSMTYPRREDGTVATDHAIVIHGIETTGDGKSYYKVRNSWGKYQRDFKVLTGSNILGIEELFWCMNSDIRVRVLKTQK